MAKLPIHAVALAFLAQGCSHQSGFDGSSPKAFAASCVAQSAILGAAMQSAPGVVAQLMSVYAIHPPEVLVTREFDPAAVIPVVGADAISSTDSATACAAMSASMDSYVHMAPDDALALGISQSLSSLTTEDAELRIVGRQIASKGDAAKALAARVRQAMDRNPPRGVTFRVVRLGQRLVPTVVIEAANAVGRPISAFLMTVRLVEADGSFLGTGKVRFAPPVPLGVGSQSIYTVDLSGVSGLDSRTVTEFSGVVRVMVLLDDLVVEGKPMLADLQAPAIDRQRLNSIEVVRSSIARFELYLRRVRSTLAQSASR